MIRKVWNKTLETIANRSSDSRIAYLRRKGCRIGENVQLNCGIKAFGTEPYLITLGNQVLIAAGVQLITHDGGVNVLRNLGKVSRKSDKIASILMGNNVYIGTGAYIMSGVKIGDNCIIDAGAVVTKDVPPDSVAVGIPARVVESVDDYCTHTLGKHCLYETKGLSREEKRKFYQDLDLVNRYFSEETP